MTLKNSSYSIRTENIKHRIGMILLVVFLFFSYFIWFLMSVQNICGQKGLKASEIRKGITGLSEPGMGFGVITMIAAVLLAVSGLRYLHSKAEVDFYHSLPVRRRTCLFVILTNDLLIFTGIIVIISVLKCAVAAAAGYFLPAFGVNTARAIVYDVLIFLVTYLTMALSMILTAHTFVGLMGFCVFAGYVPLILRNLYPALASMFYTTYYSLSEWGRAFNYFSPITLAVELISGASVRARIISLLIICVWNVILTVLVFNLYERRASEAAGKAMAFSKIKPFVRIMLVIPASVYVGLGLYSISIGSFGAWMVAGILIGGFLSHGMIECIYQFDIRGFLSHKKQMIISIAAAFVIVGIFWSDIFGYDRYVPEKEDTASVIIDNGILSTNTFWGREKKGISGEAMGETLDILKEAALKNDKNSESYYGEDAFYDEYASYTVRYRLKNRKEKIRSYILDRKLKDKLMQTVFSTREYKEDRFSLYTADWSKVTGVYINLFMKDEELALTKEEREELFKIYLEEFSGLDYNTARSEAPFGWFGVYHNSSDRQYEDGVFHTYDGYGAGNDIYYLYPSFKKTIRYLREELGLNVPTSMEDIQIHKLTMWKNGDDYDGEKSYSICNKEFIDSVKGKLVRSEMTENGECLYPLDTTVGITAEAVTEDGNVEAVLYTDSDTLEKIKNYIKMK